MECAVNEKKVFLPLMCVYVYGTVINKMNDYDVEPTSADDFNVVSC
jgi:hypothetical protein